MRILHVIGTMNPEFGGTSEAVRLLVENAPSDIASEVLSLDMASDPWLTSLSCPTHGLGPAKPPYFHSGTLVPWLKAHGTRFDGIIVHGIWTYPCYAVWRALSGRVPYVVFVHGMLDPWFKRTYPLKHAKKWVYWLAAQHWVLRAAFRVLFTTKVELEVARKSFWLRSWKPVIVPLGATAADPATPAADEAFLARCPGVRGQRFLLFLGRIHPKKGVDLLISAFARHAAEEPGLHVVIAGPDPTDWRPALAATVDAAGLYDRVHWPGMLEGDAKTGAYHLCEAFVLPSHQENFGIAVVEALAAGRPVLLSDKINIAFDAATDGCALVEPDTDEGTLRLLQRWSETPTEAREAMSAQALATFATRYNMRRNAEAMLRVFELPAIAKPEAD